MNKKTKKALWKMLEEGKIKSQPMQHDWAYRKPVRRQSTKRAAEVRQYNKRVKEWIKGKKCQVGYCTSMATECHHSRGRSNAMLLEEKFWVPLCSHHHREAHNEPEWARSVGILCQKGKWNHYD